METATTTATGTEQVEIVTPGPPKRRRRTQPDLWFVVKLPNGETHAYSTLTRASTVAKEHDVKQIELARIAPKSKGFKVVETMRV